ncbi:CHAT domain-containing tetratricopeptide repeat protein [Beggiatoa leptomitoformis]|uniref:Tetratricopeptide repeat protein n=1 Tax=Beggiatoa leptomitoformis TaxID=288004 RepID=A0A2N9YEP1_9GAMM|nr:tetratricopeptide repeat protein [Beggiatoa leptomitoformis]AUI68942.1 tetratricopeptide repeat protein [Beggiatoa leptomitoformis]QGX03774.1 tetratricopeptide repeat protein [Beggiatoa leptomitoformis]
MRIALLFFLLFSTVLGQAADLSPACERRFNAVLALKERSEWQQALRHLNILLTTDCATNVTEHINFLAHQGEVHFKLEQYAAAETDFQQLLELTTSVKNQEQMINALDWLAYIASMQTDTEKTINRYQTLLNAQESLYGQEHADIASTLNMLAEAYRLAGHYAAAEPLHQRALAIREKLLGDETLETTTSMNNLALLYYNQGNYVKARPLYEKALSIRQKMFGNTHDYVALSAENLAILYRDMNEFSLAKPLYQLVLSIQETNLGAEHANVANTANELAELYRKTGEFSQARPLYEKALTIRKKLYGDNNPYTLESLNNLAELYRQTGRYKEAEQMHKQSVQLREATYGRESIETTVSLNNLALLYYNMGRYQEAKPLYEEALATREKLLNPNHLYVSLSLNNLALLYYDMGDYPRSKALYERALAIREQQLNPEHPDIALSLNNLALLYYGMGDYGQAKKLYERALAIREKVYGKEHPDVAQSLNNLALLYYSTGDYAQSKKMYERSLQIVENVYGQEHADVALAYNNLGLLYYNIGDYAQAKPMYEKALAIWEKVFGEKNTDVALSLNNIALVYYNTGDYEQAKRYYERSLNIWETVLGKDHPRVALSLNNIGWLYYSMGDYANAKSYYERALAIREKTLGAEHPDIAQSLNGLAELNQELGNLPEAKALFERALPLASSEPELLWKVQNHYSHLLAKQAQNDDAIFWGKKAIDTIQQLRSNVKQLDKSLQTTFIEDKKTVYQQVADFLLAQGRTVEAQEILGLLKADEYADFSNTQRMGANPYNSIEQQWATRYDDINKQLVSLAKEREQLKQKKRLSTLTPEEDARYAVLLQDTKVAEQAFQRYLKELKTQLKETGSDRAMEVGERNLSKLKPLQNTLRNLGHGAVLIHYLITPDKLYIILTTPETQLVRQTVINEAILRNKLETFRTSLQTITRSPIPQAQELYNIIIKPIAADLQQADAKTLMVSLDGVLRYIPIAALHDGKNYIAENYAVVLYTEAAKSNLESKPAADSNFAGFGVSQAMDGFNALPAVEKELQSIQSVLHGEIKLNNAFNAQSLNDILDLGVPILHIASHFVFEPIGGDSNSYLLLGNGDKLTLAQIRIGYDFSPLDLLTLSACNTAMGNKKADGKEIEGFGTLAQIRGAKSVIATLWQVDDESTGQLMGKLYQLRAKNHLNKAESLQQAQLALMKDRRYQHPFYWSPFILMGNWL